MSTAPGGASTVNGVVYQLLRSLTHAARLTLRVQKGEEEFESATIVLEPSEGGDVTVNDDTLTVEQVKTRTGGKTWPLRDLVEGVLPDLYLAAKSDKEVERYRFVTDGRSGDWGEVDRFFASLKGRDVQEKGVLGCLDDSAELKFRRRPPSEGNEAFWDQDVYTERLLFDRIVAEVRKRKDVRDEPIEDTRTNVFEMLCRLEFEWELTEAVLVEEIESVLRAVSPANEKVSELRLALTSSLAEHARKGESEVSAKEFFSAHGLDAVPLSNWSLLRRRAASSLQVELGVRGYQSGVDVRAQEAIAVCDSWAAEPPVLVVSGPSGMGKSWRLMALANSIKTGNQLPVLVNSRGRIDDTLSAAAKVVSERIWGLDGSMSLYRISERRKKVIGEGGPWLTLLVDGVQTIEEATDLASQTWEDWGVRLAFACPASVASALTVEAGHRVIQSEVGLFSVQQTQQFLEQRSPGGWSAIPRDVIHALRKPLLARLYAETIAKQAWESANEYELYNAYWQRIGGGTAHAAPLDEARLKTLVRRYVDGALYPWPAEELLELGVDDACISRLQAAGWLQRDTSGTFAVSHDRLLNWAVAVTLTDDLAANRRSVAKVAELLKGYNSREVPPAGRYLGYVPMDVVWLMSKSRDLCEHLPAVIPALEEHHVQTEDLYTKLLPTVGHTLVGTLARLLEERDLMLYAQRSVIEGLCRLGGKEVIGEALEFLRSGIPRLQRYALLLLKKHPTAECLDELWDLRRRTSRDPNRWLEEHDSKHLLDEEVFDALKSCSWVEPEWVVRKAQAASADDPVHTLASLVACLPHDDGKIAWNDSRDDLLAKVDADHLWAVARCMGLFPDAADILWLCDRVTERTNLVGARCMVALTRIDPEVALQCLQDHPLIDWHSAPSWWVPELLALRPDATHEQLRLWALKPDHVWDVAKCYRGYEHEVTPELLSIVLEALDEIVKSCLTAENEDSSRWFQQFEFVATMNTKPQMERLRQWQGAEQEDRLASLVVQIGPRNSISQDSLSRDPLMRILLRIGGDGYAYAANALLAAESQWAVYDGLAWAAKRPNQATLNACEEVVRSDRLWDERIPVNQNEAAKVLAEAGRWDAVYEHIEQRWAEVLTSLSDPIEAGPPLPDELRAKALEAIAAGNETGVSPGVVDLLGFYQNADDLPLLRELLDDADPESDVATACLLSMRRIGDQSDKSVPLFERCLAGKNAHLARRALTCNHANFAYESLLRHYDELFEVALAVNLLNDPRTRERAVTPTQKHLLDLDLFFHASEVELLVSLTRDKKILQRVFEEQQVQDRLLDLAFTEEGRSWVTGAKDAAIRAVAVFDHATAVRAAQEAYENKSAHDRERYPYLIVDLLGDDAVDYLLLQIATEKSEAVQASMRRALQMVQAEDAVGAGFESGDVDRLVAACRAVPGRLENHEETLKKLAADERDRVRSAALSALKRLRRLFECDVLSAELRRATDASEQWYWASALLSLADPGDQHRPLPEWLRSCGERLSPFVWQWVVEKLKKQRESLFKELSRSTVG